MEILRFFKRCHCKTTESFRISTIQEDHFNNGNIKSFEDYFVMASSGILNIIVDPLEYAGSAPGIEFDPIVACSTAGPITIEFFINSNYTPATGTILQSSNRKSTSSKLPKVKLIKNPDDLVDGFRFAGDLVPATGAGVGNASNSNNIRSKPFEIDKTKKYLMRFKNTDGAGVLMQLKLTWTEIT